ncbi:MAG: patatin-like phospholipase family protein [Cyclobacteriaceae bacterium]|nr:patatin-like phospholipase family protein [Cyclobacteriaceae bacterium]
MTKKTKNVALVLSSGGARGIAHIGVIEALEENGYTISAIAGSSIGAVVGGMYAAGKLEVYKKWLLQLDKLEVFRLVDFTFSTQGFIRGDKVFNEMKKFVEDIKIEELTIPFSAVASDIMNRKEVVFNSGSLFTALRASAAIPLVIKPSVYNNIELVDGAVMNPIPINHVIKKKGDLVVVSDVNAPIVYRKPQKYIAIEKPKQTGIFDQFLSKWEELVPQRIQASKSKSKEAKMSYFELLSKSVDLMQDQISTHTIEKHQPDILVSVSRETCATFAFYKAEEIIEAGKSAFKKALNSNK